MKTSVYPTKHISQKIMASPAKVYEFASNGDNLPKWAAGLAESDIRKEGNHWIANSPMGEVKVMFAPRNHFGIMDHDVTLPSGEVNHNPFRVIPNGDGAEVTFVLFHLPKASDAEFEKDAKLIASDLLKLKTILEK